MTNKRLFIVIFALASVGLLSSISIFYQRLTNKEIPPQSNLEELKIKLAASEDQIRIIVGENNALRSKVTKLNDKLDGLYIKLDDITINEQEAESIKS